MSPVCDSFSTSLVDDSNSFEGSWPGILSNVSQLFFYYTGTMGFGEDDRSKVHFYTILLLKSCANSSLSPLPPKAVIVLIVAFRIKEMGLDPKYLPYSDMYYRKPFLLDWIPLVGMDSSASISQEASLRATDLIVSQLRRGTNQRQQAGHRKQGNPGS